MSADVRASGDDVTHLFKLEEIGLTLELPQSTHVIRRIPRLARPPVLDEPGFIGGNNTVVVR